MSRLALKTLCSLAEEELGKGAKRVAAYRIGQRSVLTRGRLPDLQVRAGSIPYVVCVWRREGLRVYFCDEDGRAVLGENLTWAEVGSFLGQLGKCRALFELP